MALYRKKPVIVEAVRVATLIRDASENWAALPVWFQERFALGGVVIMEGSIDLPTLEGTMTARRDDYIVRGVAGELYPCKPDIFAQTFEEVTES